MTKENSDRKEVKGIHTKSRSEGRMVNWERKGEGRWRKWRKWRRRVRRKGRRK